MRVREVAEMREEHGEVGGGVSKGGAEEDSLAAAPSTFRSLHCQKVVMSNGLEVEIFAGGGQEAQGYGREDRSSP